MLRLYAVEQMLEHTGILLPQIFLGQAKAIYRKYATGTISHVGARHEARHAFKGKPSSVLYRKRCGGSIGERVTVHVLKLVEH